MYDGVLKIRQGIDLILFKPDVKHIPFSTHIEIYRLDTRIVQNLRRGFIDAYRSAEGLQASLDRSSRDTGNMSSSVVVQDLTSRDPSITESDHTVYVSDCAQSPFERGLDAKKKLKSSLSMGSYTLSLEGGNMVKREWKMTVRGLKNPWAKVTVEFEQEQSFFSRYDEEIQRLKTIETVDSATFGELFKGWPWQYPRWVQDQLKGYDKGHLERICMVLAANPVADLTRRRAKSELSARRAGEMLVSCILLRAWDVWDWLSD
jgi:hypothetical protein